MSDITLFSTFMTISAILAVCHSSQVATMRDYAVGRKNFSTATLVATIIAPYIGGNFLSRHLSLTYQQGLYYLIPVLVGGTGHLFLIGRFLTLRMGEFMDTLSIAEAMGRLYGRTVRVITGVSGVLGQVSVIAIQFLIMGSAFELAAEPGRQTYHIFNSPERAIGIAAIALIVIRYTAFGGIRAVTFTSVFQLLAFFVLFLVLTLIVWSNFKDPNKIVHVFTTNPKFSLEKLLQWDQDTASMLGLTLYFIIPILYPSTYQRIVMARDVYQARRAFIYATAIKLLLGLLLTTVAILLLADNITLERTCVVECLINHYSYPNLKGLIAVGMVAMAMSTAGSCLNAAAVLAVNDIIKPFQKGSKEPMVLIRVFALLLGIVSLFLALSKMFMHRAIIFFMSIVTVPFLLAILGFRSSTRAVLIGMLAGSVATVIGYARFANIFTYSAIPGMAANLLFFMGSHYLLREQGGWVGIKAPAPFVDEPN